LEFDRLLETLKILLTEIDGRELGCLEFDMAARFHQFNRPYVAVAGFRSFVAARARNRFKDLDAVAYADRNLAAYLQRDQSLAH